MSTATSYFSGALRLLLAGLLIVGLAACAPGPSIRDSHGGLPVPVNEMGRIYFYRAPGILMAASEAEIVVNSRKVGNLAPGTAFYRDAFPGRYEVVLANNPEEILDFTVSAGQLTFIEITSALELSGLQHSARQVENDQGHRDLMGLTLIEPTPPK